MVEKVRLSRRFPLIGFVVLALAVTLAACSPQAPADPPPPPDAGEVAGSAEEMEGMDMSGQGDAPTVPAGMAYAEGEEIRFIHTEVSDPEVAKLLTDMMDSPVLVVPSLAQVPQEALANVYVLTNGPAGMGPLGFAPDVFDNPPGSEGYTPLRALNLVTWTDEGKARELRSAAEVLAAEQAGEVTIEQPGVVINMPFITWPGGER